MRRGKLLAAAAAVALVLGAAAAAGAATGTPGPRHSGHPDDVIIHHLSESRAQVALFWSRHRFSHARPLGLPRLAQAQPHGLVPTIRRALWVHGTGPRVRRLAGKESRIWTNHGVLPATTIGRLFVETAGGTGACSAAVIDAPNGNTVWTAGHCVSDGQGNWYTNFVFQPDRHDGTAPFGSFVPTYVATTTGYFHYSDYRYDVAALAMAQDGKSLQDQVGAQGIKIGGTSYRWRDVYDFGYPGNLFPSKVTVDPDKLRYCKVSTSKDTYYGMMKFDCNMGQGSSGGPLLWRLKPSRGWGYLVGNMSLGDQDSYYRLSPQLGTAAANVYNAIKNR